MRNHWVTPVFQTSSRKLKLVTHALTDVLVGLFEDCQTAVFAKDASGDTVGDVWIKKIKGQEYIRINVDYIFPWWSMVELYVRAFKDAFDELPEFINGTEWKRKYQLTRLSDDKIRLSQSIDVKGVDYHIAVFLTKYPGGRGRMEWKFEAPAYRTNFGLLNHMLDDDPDLWDVLRANEANLAQDATTLAEALEAYIHDTGNWLCWYSSLIQLALAMGFLQYGDQSIFKVNQSEPAE